MNWAIRHWCDYCLRVRATTDEYLRGCQVIESAEGAYYLDAGWPALLRALAVAS